ncbi:MAG: hypothetical protein P8M30_18880 [Planctomycetaceae bacterium]|nr:hypothetical protein [bacterium]MDG2391377.1 hypothetical protein [Planctomycetaceae bacterium]
MKPFVTMIILIAWMTSPATAQVIQQPVLGVNSVQTVVSVPDRGSAFLGGVSRARTSSNQFGFSPFGSSDGRGFSNSSQRVFVTIHDFKEADRQLLSAERQRTETFRNRRARNAWHQISKE